MPLFSLSSHFFPFRSLISSASTELEEPALITIRVEGGLGNQMFQHALARALQHQGKRVLLDLCNYRLNQDHNGFEISTVFPSISHDFITTPLMRTIHKIGRRRIREASADFDPSILNIKSGNLQGYWQSPCYFVSVTSRLREDFQFPPLLGNQNAEVAEQIADGPSASIHVRRGDYVDHPLLGGICTADYYAQAIKTLHTKVGPVRFFLFSDDVDWCLKNLPLPRSTVPVSWNRGANSFHDMRLISLCDHHIIANSSFSWWGTWLNAKPGKVVVAPDQWIRGERLPTLILPDWCVVTPQASDDSPVRMDPLGHLDDANAA